MDLGKDRRRNKIAVNAQESIEGLNHNLRRGVNVVLDDDVRPLRAENVQVRLQRRRVLAFLEQVRTPHRRVVQGPHVHPLKIPFGKQPPADRYPVVGEKSLHRIAQGDHKTHFAQAVPHPRRIRVQIRRSELADRFVFLPPGLFEMAQIPSLASGEILVEVLELLRRRHEDLRMLAQAQRQPSCGAFLRANADEIRARRSHRGDTPSGFLAGGPAELLRPTDARRQTNGCRAPIALPWPWRLGEQYDPAEK